MVLSFISEKKEIEFKIKVWSWKRDKGKKM
jgi:hypothetical protein